MADEYHTVEMTQHCMLVLMVCVNLRKRVAGNTKKCSIVMNFTIMSRTWEIDWKGIFVKWNLQNLFVDKHLEKWQRIDDKFGVSLEVLNPMKGEKKEIR